MHKTVRFLTITATLVGVALTAALISAVAMQAGDSDLAALGSKIAIVLALAMVVYVLPRLARSVRLEASRTDLAFRLTTGGWLFAAILLLVAILSLSTANNLIYLVLAMLASTLIVSIVSTRLSLSLLNVSLRFPDNIFAEETARLEITINNRKRLLPSFSLSVRAARRLEPLPNTPALDKLAFFAVVPARASARALFDVCFPRRGVYPIEGFSLSTRFPFGFSESRRVIDAQGEIVVYPKPRPLNDFFDLLPISQGQIETAARGSGNDLYAIRPYSRTDHPHHIDWKATAKTTVLQVREFSRDDDWRTTIALDTSHNSGVSEEMFERAVILAASLVMHFIDQAAEIRLMLGEDDSGFGSTLKHGHFLLSQLARLPSVGAVPEGVLTESVEAIDRLPWSDADSEFRILITGAQRGSIPARILRSAHVIYFEDIVDEPSEGQSERRYFQGEVEGPAGAS
jgi:uncharacterized protein (DUF58 family)